MSQLLLNGGLRLRVGIGDLEFDKAIRPIWNPVMLPNMTAKAERLQEKLRLRRLFEETLSLAEDVSFIRMLWAVHALQTDRVEIAAPFLRGYPDEACKSGILGQKAIFPWELETLANELLVAHKHPYYRVGNWHQWNEIWALINLLRSLENSESALRRENRDMLVETGRLGSRQFNWQRGHYSPAQMYRNVLVYGQGECASYLADSASMNAADITLVGFCLAAVLLAAPSTRPLADFQVIEQLTSGRDVFKRTMSRIARPLGELRREAQTLRNVETETAYKPSVLRRFPCVFVGRRDQTLIAPLPTLIMDRVTNGLFYDVIEGGGSVRDEIGRRFEAYSYALLDAMLPGSNFARETKYNSAKGQMATPDILMLGNEGAVQLAIECKASRMGIDARFGTAPQEDRGYEEIAKGVMQLWRFLAHCENGSAPYRTKHNVRSLILTMDDWFAARPKVIAQIMARANTLADNGVHEIPESCRKAVAFCPIADLEDVLQTASEASFLESVEIGSGNKQGWLFAAIHAETSSPKTEPKNYPFESELKNLLPWYSRLDELSDD